MSNEPLKILETERRYVARELHDGVAQTTLQLGLQAGICLKLLERGNLDMLANELAVLEQRLKLAGSQVREIIHDLRPPQVDQGADLEEYLQQVIDTHRRRGGPPVTYHNELTGDPPSLSPLHLLTLVRIVQEALLNIRKHAQAEAVHLTLVDDSDHFYLIIRDDGKGFDSAQETAPAAPRDGAGLANLRARAQLMGGMAAITRDAAGSWTEVKVSLPVFSQ